jgi:hypothetical protein
VNVPGLEGDAGLAGDDGTNGIDSFTFTTADFTMPAASGTEVVEVANTDWMVVGQPIFVQVAGMMQVVSIVDGTHVELENLGYSQNAAGGTNIPSGSGVAPGGFEPDVSGFAASGVNSDITRLTGLTTPLPVNEGGTGATTATNARTNFGLKSNANIADVVANAADTYLTGSALLIPTDGLKAGTVARWRFFLTKTAAGVAAPVWSVRVGVAGTTGDTARLTFTGPAQTAAADTAEVIIEAVLRNIGAAGVLAGGLTLNHNLAATGFANQGAVVLQNTSAGFDTTPANLILGVSVDPGAAGVWTHQLVRAELWLNN